MVRRDRLDADQGRVSSDLPKLVDFAPPAGLSMPARAMTGMKAGPGCLPMVENTTARIAASGDGTLQRLALTFVACTVAGSMAASHPAFTSAARAAEVDAIGVPAPLGFADIIERVKPAVVGVRVKVEDTAAADDTQPQQQQRPTDPPLRKFGTPAPEKPAPNPGIALGSGFFISGDGYVVTNNHVVANGVGFEVTTDTGKTYQAKVVGTDPQTDLAILKVSASTEFAYVRFATGLPRVGDWVLAVGNPFGLGGTVTAGIVSARSRDIGEGPYDDFIQIDAPVNVGNSGGPTFNVKGEVIGVNTAIFSPSGGSVGVAFDIPADTVKFVVQQIKEKGVVTRGWLGVQIQTLSPAIADALALKSVDGALVAQVEPNSPAAKAGIEIGDVINAVNGEAVKDSRELARRIAAMAPGTTTKFGVWRAGQEKTITVTLGKLPRKSTEAKGEEQKPHETPVLGLTLAPASGVAGASAQGVVIAEIDPSGRAAESGLQTGDVILDVGRRSVNTPADVRKFVDEARAQSKRSVLLRVRRGDMVVFAAVPIG
jgi:serine protease Do